MPSTNQSTEYKQRVNLVINFILQHLQDDLRLEKLAPIANYSPFHFQKVFKEITGESPKQFIVRMRLGNAAHFVITHLHKSIAEISMESGFASPSTFARAFKNYYGISAEDLRSLSPEDQIIFRQSASAKKNPDSKLFVSKYDVRYWKNNLKVTLKRITSIRAIFINAPLADVTKIQDGYKKLALFAETKDLVAQSSKFVGIINPHAGLYQACVSIPTGKLIPKHLDIKEIEGGTFATFRIKGNSLHTFHALHAFYEMWLPKSGHRIKQSYVLEILLQNTLTKNYVNLSREIYVPIEPS